MLASSFNALKLKAAPWSFRSEDDPLLSLRDYVRLAVPEPEVLRLIGQESKRQRTAKLSSSQIDQIVKAARKTKRR